MEYCVTMKNDKVEVYFLLWKEDCKIWWKSQVKEENIQYNPFLSKHYLCMIYVWKHTYYLDNCKKKDMYQNITVYLQKNFLIILSSTINTISKIKCILKKWIKETLTKIQIHKSCLKKSTFLYIKNNCLGASLVAQWLRICLPMQGTRVRALVWEDPTCRGTAGPVSQNYWACASGACAPQQERPR